MNGIEHLTSLKCEWDRTFDKSEELVGRRHSGKQSLVSSQRNGIGKSLKSE